MPFMLRRFLCFIALYVFFWKSIRNDAFLLFVPASFRKDFSLKQTHHLKSTLLYIVFLLCTLGGAKAAAMPMYQGDSIVHTFRKDTAIYSSKKDTVIFKNDSATTATAKPIHKKSSLNDTWYYSSYPDKRYIIDTSISILHRFDVVHRDGPEYFNIGNTGSEAYPLVFNPSPDVGFNMGFRQFDIYRFNRDSIRYYQVIRPYAEIFYTIGISKEQVFEGRFANSHKSGVMYGVDFRRIYSNGVYNNSKTSDNGFSLYGIYNTKNKMFNIETDLIYNSFVAEENGGLTTDIFFKDTSFLSKSLVPTYLNQAILNYNEIDWFLKASYNLGRKYNERINDTTVQRVTLPIFRVSYQLDIQRDKYSYYDNNNDSAYYNDPGTNSSLGSTIIGTGDTLRYNSQFIKIGERFGLDFNAKKLTSDSTYKHLNFLMGAAFSFDYYMLDEFQNKEDFGNVYVSGYLKSNPALNSRLIYKATVAYYLAGYNQNDLSADGQLGVDLHPFGRLTAGAGYQLRQSDWVYHSFKADSATAIPYTNTNGLVSYNTVDNTTFRYYNDFPKMSTVKFGGEYVLDKYGIKASAYNYIINNYFYFSGPYTPAVVTSTINMLVLYFANRFGIKGFHFDNDVWFQKSAGSDVIRLPLVTLKSSVYYERHIFKNAMWLAIGADLRYYTPYDANGYSPLTGQFYEQNYQQMKFYPVLDLFLNVKIKTVRVFLTGTNLSSFFGPQKGYYTAYYYPANPASFKFGAAWRFFE
jgi:hypothetical protein